MSEQPTPTDGAPPRSRLVRWLLMGGALFGVVYVVLQFVPIYYVDYERDATGGAVEFLRKLQALQAEHLDRHGRYLGDEEWAEWPAGSFPTPDGVAWGKPTAGAWAQVTLRPREPVLFKFRLRASERAERAPKDLLPVPPTGPWYVAQARADLDGDQVIWLIEVSSAGPAIYFENSDD